FPPTTCSSLIRREVAVRVGGFENEFRGMFDDQAFFAKVFAGYDVLVDSQCLDRYRQHPESACAVAFDSGIYHPDLPNEARDRYLGWLDDYLAQLPNTRRLRRRIARERWFFRHRIFARLRRRLNERVGVITGSGASAVVAIGRRVLPAELRRQLWERWGQHLFSPAEVALSHETQSETTRTEPAG